MTFNISIQTMNSTNDLIEINLNSSLGEKRSATEAGLWAALVGIIMAASLLGNISVFLSIRHSPELQRDKANIFLKNLAVTDILSAAVIMSSCVWSLLYNGWLLGEFLCDITCALNYTLIIVSMMSMGFIALERYVYIVHALKHHSIFTRRRIYIMIGYSWLQGVGFGLFPVLRKWVRYDYWEAVCAIEWHHDKDTIPYVIIAFVTCFLLPSAVIVFAYTKVVKMAVRKSKTRSKLPKKRENTEMIYGGESKPNKKGTDKIKLKSTIKVRLNSKINASTKIHSNCCINVSTPEEAKSNSNSKIHISAAEEVKIHKKCCISPTHKEAKSNSNFKINVSAAEEAKIHTKCCISPTHKEAKSNSNSKINASAAEEAKIHTKCCISPTRKEAKSNSNSKINDSAAEVAKILSNSKINDSTDEEAKIRSKSYLNISPPKESRSPSNSISQRLIRFIYPEEAEQDKINDSSDEEAKIRSKSYFNISPPKESRSPSNSISQRLIRFITPEEAEQDNNEEKVMKKSILLSPISFHFDKKIDNTVDEMMEENKQPNRYSRSRFSQNLVQRFTLNRKEKAIKSFVIVCGAYLVCMTPFSCSKLYKVLNPNPEALMGRLNLVASVFAFLSSAINPIIFAIFHKPFRKEYVALMRRSRASIFKVF